MRDGAFNLKKRKLNFTKISQEAKIAFCTTLIVGLIAHFYKFVNNLPNWDSLMVYYYPTHNMIQQGRHLQGIIAAIRGYVDAPWLIGILCLLYMGVAAALLTETFQLQNPIVIILTSATIVVSPTVISGFGFMYMADAFAGAYVLAVAAFFVTLRYQNGWIVGGLLLAFSMGSYQAYLPVAATLVLLWMIKTIIDSKQGKLGKKFWQQVGKYVLMGITAGIVYKVSLSVLQRIQRAVLIDHQGMGSMHFPNLQEVINALKKSYVDSIYYFVGSVSHINGYSIVNIICIICFISLLIITLIKSKINRQPGKLILILISLAIYPCISHLFYFATNEVQYHALMQFSLVLFYLFLFWLVERNITDHIVLSKIAIFAGTLLVYVLIVTANQAYRAETLSYEKTYAMVNRIVDRIEQLPEYEDAQQIAVVGYLEQTDGSIYGTNPGLAGYTDSFFITHHKHVVAMLNEYFGVNLQGVSDEKLKQLEEMPEIQKMDVWPKKNSIMQKGNIIILKLGEI